MVKIVPYHRLIAAAVLAAAGCAPSEYHPSLLPLFFGDHSGEIASQPVSAPLEPAAEKPVPPADIKPAADPAPAEEKLPAPRPEPVADTGLSLDQAITACLNSDPKLRAGFETINQAKADVVTSSLRPNPVLSGDGQLIPLGHPFTVDRQGGPPQTDWQVAYPVDWFLFGKRAAAMASARLGADVSAADFADLVRQRVAATIAAYYDVLEAEAFLKLAKSDLDNLHRVETMTNERVKLGGVGSIESDRIRLAVIDSQREVRNRQKNLVTAIATLRALMGANEPCPTFHVQGNLEVPTPVAAPATEEALAIAQEFRPDLISLQRQIAKAEADIRVEKSKACPQVTPQIGYTRQFQSKAIGFPDASSYSVGLNMSLPFFDRNQGNIDKAQSLAVQSQFNLDAQMVALRAEIVQAVHEFTAARENVTEDDPAQLKAAASVRDRIEAAYKAGGRTLLDVLDAERAYRDTYRNYITGHSSYWHSLYRLNASMGKQVLR